MFWFVNPWDPWFIRGGTYFHGVGASVFVFLFGNAGVWDGYSFRVTFTMINI
jgi:hypothetical protein